jgi:hypothetical protein
MHARLIKMKQMKKVGFERVFVWCFILIFLLNCSGEESSMWLFFYKYRIFLLMVNLFIYK